MKLADVFQQLAGSEFSQLSLIDDITGTVAEAKQVQVIGHINLGLTALYRRFELKQNRITIQTQVGRRMYQMNSNFARSSKSSRLPTDQRFILDSSDAPFKDDILNIQRVLRDGCDLDLNTGDDGSCYTPSNTVLNVPVFKDSVGNEIAPQLTVVYKANHPLIVKGIGLFDPARIDLELPPAFLEALLYFVGSRATNPSGAMSNNFSMGNNYAGKFEAACKDLEENGSAPERNNQSNRFRDNGWV